MEESAEDRSSEERDTSASSEETEEEEDYNDEAVVIVYNGINTYNGTSYNGTGYNGTVRSLPLLDEDESAAHELVKTLNEIIARMTGN